MKGNATYLRAQRAEKERARRIEAENELNQALEDMTSYTHNPTTTTADDDGAATARSRFGAREMPKTYGARADETPRDIADAMPFVFVDELVRQNRHRYPGLEADSRLFAGTVIEIPETAHARWRASTEAAVEDYVKEYDVRLEKLREKDAPELDNIAKMSLRNRRAALNEWRRVKLKKWDGSAAFRTTRMYDHFGAVRVESRADYAQQLQAKIERRIGEKRASLAKAHFMKKNERQIEATRKLARLAFDGGFREDDEWEMVGDGEGDASYHF